MKRLFLIATLCIASVTVFAQKSVVVVDYFDRSDNVSNAHADAVRSSVIQGINQMNRLTLIDAAKESSLALEEERRDSEKAALDMTARTGQMKTLGAQFIVTGSVTNVASTKRTDSEGKVSYRGNIVYSVTVLKVEDGSVVGTKNFTHSDIATGSGSTPELAINDTYSYCVNDMEELVQEFFPLKGTIVEMAEAKGDKVKSCYISLGTAVGVLKGQTLDAFAVKTVAGRAIETKIGSLTISEVVAEDLSLCKVTTGAKEIMAASKDGMEIVVKTKPDPLWKVW